MAWTNIGKSRYNVDFDLENNNVSFILAGPTFGDRQDIYKELISNHLATPRIRCNLWENIDLPDVKFTMEIDDIGFVNIKEISSGDIFGVVTKQNGFDSNLYAIWSSLSEEQKLEAIKIDKIIFDAWNSDTILIGVKVNFFDVQLTDEAPAIGMDRVDNTHEVTIALQTATEPAAETIIETLKVNDIEEAIEAIDAASADFHSRICKTYTVRFPYQYEVKSWDDFRKLAFSNVASLFFIKRLTEVSNDNTVSLQVESE